MNKPRPLFTIPHLITAIFCVAAITLTVLFAVNPVEIANKALDIRLSRLATTEDPKKDCAVFQSCELLPSLVNDKCFVPHSFYYKRQSILEHKVFMLEDATKKMIRTNVCNPKAADWQALNCFTCL